MYLIPCLVWAAMVAAGLAAEPGQAQVEPEGGDKTGTVWDGVYTAAQAARGRDHYVSTCQLCHGADLTGGAGRPLTGETFMRGWRAVKLDVLLERVRAMPPGAESRLGDDVYLDIIAFLLEANDFPAGADELKPGTLGDILIQGEDGPQPVEDFALAQVVGCLTSDPDNTWVVTSASEPARTRNPDPSKDDDLKEAQAKALGTGTIQLLHAYPSPASYQGHRVEAKGFLIRNPKHSLNVTALQSLAPSCEGSASLP